MIYHIKYIEIYFIYYIYFIYIYISYDISYKIYHAQNAAKELFPDSSLKNKKLINSLKSYVKGYRYIIETKLHAFTLYIAFLRNKKK